MQAYTCRLCKHAVHADTLQIIAQLARSKSDFTEVQIMNVDKNLVLQIVPPYAMAVVTCLALNIDPLKVVHYQEQLRPHLIQPLEKNNNTLSYIKTVEASNFC